MALRGGPQFWLLCHARNQTFHLFLYGTSCSFTLQVWLKLTSSLNPLHCIITILPTPHALFQFTLFIQFILTSSYLLTLQTIHRILENIKSMDILDEMSSAHLAKTSTKKNKTSIMANETLTKSIALGQHNRNMSSIVRPINQHPSSFQHLKNTHFDVNISNQKINQAESHKDTYTMGTQKQNKGVVSGIPSSLGIIMSQQNSEESKNTIHNRNSRRQDKTNNIKNVSSCPIEIEDLKDKIRQLQDKNNEFKFKLTQLEAQSNEKSFKIKDLQQKLQKQYNRNSEDRRKLLQQHSQLFQKQLGKINKTHQAQIKRRQQLATWQAKNKQAVLNAQISSLKGVIQKYSILLESGNLMSEEKKKLQLKYEKQNMEMKADKEKYTRMEQDINRKTKELQQKMNEFYNQRRQSDRKMDRIKQQLDEQKTKIKKQELRMRRQLREKQEQFQYKINQKTKQFNQKQRKLEIQYHEVSILKLAMLKQKDQNKQLTDKINIQLKQNQHKLLEEKERVYKKQSQLLQKLHTVQMYFQSSKKCSCNRSSSQKMLLMVPEINEEPNQKQKKNSSKEKDSKIGSENLIQDQNLRKKIQNKKINVGDYLLKLQRTASATKLSNRAIYKLQQFYM